MNVRNFLHPADFVTLVPDGIAVTLQYNDKGVVERGYLGLTPADRAELPNDVYDAFKASDKFRSLRSISIKGGTTWISGVFYTSDRPDSGRGQLPASTLPYYLTQFASDCSTFSFYAANIQSQAAKLSGAVNVRRWLTLAKFDLLPGFVAPAQINRQSFDYCIRNSKFNLGYPVIPQYLIFSMGDVTCVNAELYAGVVKSVKRSIDQWGHIKASVNIADDPVALSFDYSEIFRMNVCANSMIIYHSDNIISAYSTDNKQREHRPNKLTCDYCGALISIPATGPVKCDNDCCMSTRYSNVNNLLDAFQLPNIDFSTYIKHVRDKKIIADLDVFDLPEYAAAELNTSISNLLSHIIPSYVADVDTLRALVNGSNNTVVTVRFYLSHPNKIVSNLGLSNNRVYKLVSWLNVDTNINNVLQILDYPRINFADVGVKFSASPIFRNKVIMITGQFIHGDNAEMGAILRSYGAQVTSVFDSSVDCVVVGSIPTDVDGVSVRRARETNVAVFSESEFFKRFMIDEDIAGNLH